MAEYEFPECTSFGSVIRFALELEKAASTIYEELAGRPDLITAQDSMKALADVHKKRGQVLEHTRREKLNEMILEPIQDLDSSKYVIETELPGSIDLAGAKAFAGKVEETSSMFYSDSSKIASSLLAEAARIFERMGKENLANKAKLDAL